MSFNTDNCVVLWLHPQQTKDKNVQYQLNGEPLGSVRHKRDLGVIVDETLKPHRQYAMAAKSGNSTMKVIKEGEGRSNRAAREVSRVCSVKRIMSL